MSKREKVYLRVTKEGYFAPADSYAASLCRARAYRIGDLLQADISKPRNPKFNRLVHRLGKLVVENVDAFAGLDAHKAIKRLQIEGKVACDEIGIYAPGYGMLIQFIPRSLSYETMDEAEYQQAARGISRTIAERYMQGLTPEVVEELAQSMIDE